MRYGIVPMLVALILLNLAIYLLDPDFFNREHNWRHYFRGTADRKHE